MVGGILRAGLLAFSCLLMAPVALAQSNTETQDDAFELLQKAQLAARQSDYDGVFTYQQGATMQSSRVVHLVDGTGERERLEILDGAPREFILQDDMVHCLLPEKKVVVIEDRRIDRFPSLLIGQAEGLADFYSFHMAGTPERVAGRQCVLVDVIPKDEHRYGYRLCIDSQTHLLLKAQTLDTDRKVVDQIAFTSVRLGNDVRADQIESAWDTKDWKTVRPIVTPIDIASLGWRIAPLPGFDYVTQISRPMRSGATVKQLVLSDGLAAISVFIEAVSETQERKALPKGGARTGAINIYGARIGDHWFTAIGEVPSGTLRELADHTEYVPLAVPSN